MNSIVKPYWSGSYDADGAPTFQNVPGVDPSRPNVCTVCGKRFEDCDWGTCPAGKVRMEMSIARSEARIAKREGPSTPDTGNWIN